KATIPLGLCLLILGAPALRAQPSPQQTAIDEDVRRQAARITLRNTLAQAHEAEARHDLLGAAKQYDAAYELILSIGTQVGPELKATQEGLARVRMPLAVAAQRRGDLHAADEDVKDILRVDPKNPQAMEFKQVNDRMLAEAFPKTPNKEAIVRVQE